MAKHTYGTGGFLLLHTGTTPIPSPNGLLTTVAWDLGERPEYAEERYAGWRRAVERAKGWASPDTANS